jgi:hypothetical protein
MSGGGHYNAHKSAILTALCSSLIPDQVADRLDSLMPLEVDAVGIPFRPSSREEMSAVCGGLDFCKRLDGMFPSMHTL